MREEVVDVGHGVRLRARAWGGDGRPFLLVHGLASNARLWDGVAAQLAAAGHRVVAVDQRGHGRSDQPGTGFTIERCTADLLAVITGLGLEQPVVAGQSWGANVVLQLAADHGELIHAAALVDGGWIRLRATFPDWATCAEQLRPPSSRARTSSASKARFGRPTPTGPTGDPGTLANFEVLPDTTVRPWLALDDHLAILRDLWEHDPRTVFATVAPPILLVPADHGGDGAAMVAKRQAVAEALELLADGRVRWFGPPADHDLHAQHPADVAGLLLELADAPGR